MKITIPNKAPRRTRHAQTSITEREHERLKQLADEHGISVGAVVYALLQPHLQATHEAAT